MDTLRAAHVAKLLGVSRERARQIAQRDPTFPEPVETEPYRRWDQDWLSGALRAAHELLTVAGANDLLEN